MQHIFFAKSAHLGGELGRTDGSHTTSTVGTSAVCLMFPLLSWGTTTCMLASGRFSSASPAEEGFALRLRGSPAKINSPTANRCVEGQHSTQATIGSLFTCLFWMWLQESSALQVGCGPSFFGWIIHNLFFPLTLRLLVN